MTKPPSPTSNEGIIRFSVCALGICACYMYYGVVQESLFKKQKIGPSFVLLIQCVTNSIVARVWQSLDQWMSKANSKNTDSDAHKKKNDDATTTPDTNKNNSTALRLHHPLLGIISLCYVSAMVCSNESLHFVSYPTAVLAKSCKLIPTMAMGVLIEKKAYAWFEWTAALCITAGIVLFNFSRMSQKGKNNDDDEDSWIGLGLLSLSLIADGFLGSCQGLLKQKRTLSMPSWVSGGKQGREVPVRPPNAVETMLFVNLYAIIYLIPLTIANHQMEEGLSLLRGTTDPENHTTLLKGMLVLNTTVAVGQIFIFLTITWYSSLVCTTITTTRKFFTILLSVMYFGHHFRVLEWIATGLVFCGLYLGIMGQRAKQHQKPIGKEKDGYTKAAEREYMNDFSTTHFARLDSTKMD